MLALQLAQDAELRALEPWNAAEFAEHVERARDHIKPWIPWGSTVVDEPTARELLQRYADRQAKDEARIYGIWVDGVLHGGTLFRTFDAGRGVCEVGVWLDPGVTGRGLITNAVRHMIDWAVCVRGMSRVEWRAESANERSIVAAQRLGMSRDGVLRQASELHGTRRDIEVWSVLATEWHGRN